MQRKDRFSKRLNKFHFVFTSYMIWIAQLVTRASQRNKGQGVPVNWQNECVCPLFEKNRASQVTFGKCLKLSKNLLKPKRLKLKCLKL
jgi:hypothetical protein